MLFIAIFRNVLSKAEWSWSHNFMNIFNSGNRNTSIFIHVTTQQNATLFQLLWGYFNDFSHLYVWHCRMSFSKTKPTNKWIHVVDRKLIERLLFKICSQNIGYWSRVEICKHLFSKRFNFIKLFLFVQSFFLKCAYTQYDFPHVASRIYFPRNAIK